MFKIKSIKLELTKYLEYEVITVFLNTLKENNMIRNITDEQARHMVELLIKKSELVKNFSHKLEKYRVSGDRETYSKKFKELLEKEEIKVYGKKIE